ncbi:MAG: type II toxin-antitoxin system VapC family toxin [Chloroflexi bacterium]|nr:type II toxin-antitoxin system VapC family toxin [Chloroflexota bacterium]
MKPDGYLLDTRALIFWVDRSLSVEFVSFLNAHNRQGRLFVSAVSFWEIALLAQKGRITIDNTHAWANEVLAASGVRLLTPAVTEMINSAQLPARHKDPFDRLLIAQSVAHNLALVTRDRAIHAYNVHCFWM